MAHEKIKALITFIAVFIIVGAVSWALVNAQHLPQQIGQDQTGLPESMPKLRLYEDIRDSAMSFIKDNHPETTQFMNNLEWTGGKTTPDGILGAENYTYSSGKGWKVIIQYPVIPNPTYDITINYSATPESISIPYNIAWTGTSANWAIIETSYTFAQ